MFDSWQNLTRWLDSPQADWIHLACEDSRISIELATEILEDFELSASRTNMQRLADAISFAGIA